MVEVLFTKKSENLCGRSADGIDGRDEVFDLPRNVFVMLNNCLDEVHARILVLKNLYFACCTILLTNLQAEFLLVQNEPTWLHSELLSFGQKNSFLFLYADKRFQAKLLLRFGFPLKNVRLKVLFNFFFLSP